MKEPGQGQQRHDSDPLPGERDRRSSKRRRFQVSKYCLPFTSFLSSVEAHLVRILSHRCNARLALATLAVILLCSTPFIFYAHIKRVNKTNYLRFPVVVEGGTTFLGLVRRSDGANECPFEQQADVAERVIAHVFVTHYNRHQRFKRCLQTLMDAEQGTRNWHLHIADFPSGDARADAELADIIDALPVPHTHYRYKLPFSKSYAMSAMLVNLPLTDIAITIDADYTFSRPIIDEMRRYTVPGKQFYAPIIMFAEYEGVPADWYPEGYGFMSFSGADYFQVGQYALPGSPYESKPTWGDEENEFAGRSKEAGIQICRRKHDDVMHPYHDRPQDEEWYASYHARMAWRNGTRMLLGVAVVAVLLIAVRIVYKVNKRRKSDAWEARHV